VRSIPGDAGDAELVAGSSTAPAAQDVALQESEEGFHGRGSFFAGEIFINLGAAQRRAEAGCRERDAESGQ
jgi:hypothetical protein